MDSSGPSAASFSSWGKQGPPVARKSPTTEGTISLHKPRAIPKRPQGPPKPLVTPPPLKIPNYSSQDSGMTSKLNATSKLEKIVQGEVSAMENRLMRLRTAVSKAAFKDSLTQRHLELVKNKRRVDDETARLLEMSYEERQRDLQSRAQARATAKAKKEDHRFHMESMFLQKHKEAREMKCTLHSLKDELLGEQVDFAGYIRSEAQAQREESKQRTIELKQLAELRRAELVKSRAEEKRQNEKMIREERDRVAERRKQMKDSIHATKSTSLDLQESRRQANKDVVLSMAQTTLEKKEENVARLKDYMDHMRHMENDLMNKIRAIEDH